MVNQIDFLNFICLISIKKHLDNLEKVEHLILMISNGI